MDADKLRKLLEESGKTDLSVLISAKEQAKAKVLDDPTQGNLLALEKAEKLLKAVMGKDSETSESNRFTKSEFVVGEPLLPTKFALGQNYPNPFNPETIIRFDIPEVSDNTVETRLLIYNVRGELVKRLVDEEYEPGFHEVLWDGRNDWGTMVSSGIYFYTFSAENFYTARKMILLK